MVTYIKSFFSMRQQAIAFSFALLFTGGLQAQDPQTAYSYTIKKTATTTHGAVVSAHPLASSAGVAILRQGGNAFDAAIATQLALAVVYPAAGNIGGGGFMVAHLTNKGANSGAKAGTSGDSTGAGTNITIDFREKAPAAATRDMYLDSAGNPR